MAADPDRPSSAVRAGMKAAATEASDLPVPAEEG
jgi:hypothetical protein